MAYMICICYAYDIVDGVSVAMTMAVADMDRLCRSHNWAIVVGKRVGVAMTTAMMSSSASALPYGSYHSNSYKHLQHCMVQM
jgi:hypothetical protein